jgi:hypothetical protein
VNCQSINFNDEGFVSLTENCEGIGAVQIAVKSFEEEEIFIGELNVFQKAYRYIALFIYSIYRVSIGRLFDKRRPKFTNIPYNNPHVRE